MNKKLFIMLAILPFIIFAGMYIYFAYNPTKSLSYNQPSTQSKTVTTQVTLPAPIYIDDTDNVDSITDINGQLHMLLPVAHINQLPELPTGCEITALTTLLNYLGFKVDKMYMADNYLDKLETFDGSFYDYFIGDPTTTNSWGCFAPAITTSANRYLFDQHSSLFAHNISGSSIKALLSEIADGNPVLVWTSSKPGTETIYSPIQLNDNSVFNWPSNEHCVVLIGFNLEKGTVFLSDPLNDIIEYDLDAFANEYNAYYKQAVVIK